MPADEATASCPSPYLWFGVASPNLRTLQISENKPDLFLLGTLGLGTRALDSGSRSVPQLGF